MNYLARITERVNRLGDPDDPDTLRPLVTIDEFFVGNPEPGSIGCNLLCSPTPDQFYAVFQSIASRPEVEDVRVQITAFDLEEWPFTDTVYVMTSASPEEVKAWFPEDLRPDDTWVGFADQAYEPYEVPAGTQPIACFWD